MQENKNTVFGDAPSLYRYLCLTKRPAYLGSVGSVKDQEIKDSFYPRAKMNADRKKVIDCFLEYIEMMVRRNSSRMTKLIIMKISNENIKGFQDDYEIYDTATNTQQLSDERRIFFDVILSNLEK